MVPSSSPTLLLTGAASTASPPWFIDPGSPWQNAWIESFNGRLRDELLNGWTFDSLFEAQVLIEAWRVDYNNHRPHSTHSGPTALSIPRFGGRVRSGDHAALWAAS